MVGAVLLLGVLVFGVIQRKKHLDEKEMRSSTMEPKVGGPSNLGLQEVDVELVSGRGAAVAEAHV